MSKKYTKISLIIILALLFAGETYSRTAPYDVSGNKELPVNIKAININYDKKNNFLFAKGNVEIIQGNRVLNADNVRINLITRDTEARGNVKLKEGEDIITCNEFNINLDSQVGEVSNAKIFVKEQNIHIQGNNIKKTGLNTYQVTSGTITTCDGSNPAWKIKAKKIDLTVNGYAQVRGSTFRVKGFPIFYLPYAILPVKTERQTGLLYPEIGRSNKKGAFMDNSFFWALSENTDATFWLDYASRKGPGGGLEYRFKLKEDTWGKFYGYFADEQSSYFDNEYRDKRDRSNERGYLNFEGEHYFSEDFYMKSQGSYITDREFYNDYKKAVKRSKGEIKKSTIKSLEKDESLVFFNKNWDFYNLMANFDLYKNLTHGDPYTLQRLPQVVFSSMRRPIIGSPFFYQFDSSYNFFWREEGQKGQRVDVFPTISLPLNYQGWLKFNTEAGLRSMVNYNLDHEKGLKEEGVFPTIQSELSTVFMRIYTPDNKWLKKLKHTIEPGILYEFEPSNDQSDFPDFDIPDKFYTRHNIGYYVKNRFTGLFAGDTDELKEQEIGYFMIGQFYNINRPRGGLYLEGNPRKDYSDIFAEIRISILPLLYFKTKAAYNPYGNDLRYYNALINWSNRKGEYLEFEYRYARERFEIIDLRGKFRLSRLVLLYFDTKYDSHDHNEIDSEIGLDYSAQCWGAKISVESSGASGGASSDTSFNFSLYLKGLGGSQ
jgi:LPS-assembly protein